nr:RNA-dependent RNA polymerase [buhirugu virus 2]
MSFQQTNNNATNNINSLEELAAQELIAAQFEGNLDGFFCTFYVQSRPQLLDLENECYCMDDYDCGCDRVKREEELRKLIFLTSDVYGYNFDEWKGLVWKFVQNYCPEHRYGTRFGNGLLIVSPRFFMDHLDWFQQWKMISSNDECRAFLRKRTQLLMSGDVESNPGPVQSRPVYARNNDPRAIRLEKALQRRDEKITTLIKKLRQEIKSKKIYTQGFFDDLKGAKGEVGQLNGNLTRICDFLENSLPALTTQIQTTVLTTTDKYVNLKEDLLKVAILLVLVRLLMVWKKYRAALIVIILFVMRFYGFDKQILDIVMDLKDKILQTTTQVGKEALEEVVYHPWFDSCGKLIFAVLAFFAIKKIPGKQDWDNYISRLDRIPKAVEGSKKIVDYCSEYFNIAVDEVKKVVLGKELKGTQGLYDEIHAWAKEIRHYLDLDERNKITLDTETAAKVEDLYKRGLKYAEEKIPDRDIARLITTMLFPAKSLYEQVLLSPVKGGGPKMRPITVWLTGESGIGKTQMIYPLCIDILREMGIVKPDAYKHQAYARQVETEYWDGYNGQKIVIYDDAFQLKDDKTKPNPEIFEVIRTCNTFPQHLHMAALQDKNMYSQAEVLLYTTNQFQVQLESITFPDAFYNRMKTHAYSVQIKQDKSIWVKNARGQEYNALDVTKLNKDEAIDLSVYEFQKMRFDDESPTKWVDEGAPISYEEFAKTICKAWKEEKEKTFHQLKWLETYASRTTTQGGSEASEYHDSDDGTYFSNLLAKGFMEGKSLVEMEAEFAIDAETYNSYMTYKQGIAKETKWSKWLRIVDEQLNTLKDKINNLKDKACKIISEHPYLTALGFIGVMISAFAMYSFFERTLTDDTITSEVGSSGDQKTPKVSKRVVEVGNSGDLKTTKTPKTAVEVGSSGDSKTMKNKITNVEVGSSGDAKTQKMRSTKVEVGKELEKEAETQGCSDPAAHALVLDVLQKNTYCLYYERMIKGEMKRFRLGNSTFLRGWVCMMPYHFIETLYARKVAPSTNIYFSQPNCDDIITIPVSHLIAPNAERVELTTACTQIRYKDETARDCVLVNLHRRMCHPHRDILKHFVKKSDQGSLRGVFQGTLATFHQSATELCRAYQWLQAIRPLDQEITIYHDDTDTYDYEHESYTQRDCYEYNAPTQTGDCGSIVGLYNKRMERKLIGMHIAGNVSECHGYACPLTQEAILDGLDRLEKLDPVNNITVQCCFEPPIDIKDTMTGETPEGKFCAIGKSNIKVGQAVKTTLVKSCMYGMLSKPITKPAHLTPTKLPNGEIVNPLMKGLKKCGVDTAVLDEEIVESAALDVKQIVLTQYNSMLDVNKYRRFLTYEEAIQGTGDDDFMKGIARQTSPGYRYSQMQKKLPGKQDWMGSGEQYDFTSQRARELRKDVENLIDDCANCVIRDVVFVDTLKDERRPIEKVDAGKTRVFSAGPQHFVVAFRKYFLPFAAYLMNNRIDNEIAVGTNVYSTDWERIAKRLKKHGNKVIAGDFGNFDGSLVAQVLWAIFWEVFYPWFLTFNDTTTETGKRNLKICIGLWTHIVHSVHTYGDNVYMWTHSQPSGNPFTVIINCLYNSMIMRIVWIMLARKLAPEMQSMKKFRENVSMISYGDDNCLNISDRVIEWFNQITISEQMKEIKHEYTDEGKTGDMVKYRTLSEIQFLKRGFIFSQQLQRTVAPLQKDVIYEMLNWTRNTIDPNEILMMNINTAFREIVYHGKSEYQKLRSGIEDLAMRGILPQQPQILTFEAYLWDATMLADEVYDF